MTLALVTFDSTAAQYLVYGGLIVVGILLLVFGYKIGSWMTQLRYQKQIESSKADLFTTQQGFKQLYETEIAQLKEQLASQTRECERLKQRTEEYRKKAAGFGGLFGSGGKHSDAMYALLLENEALEEALHKQNEKLNVERAEAVQESLRNTGYRRVLMSQLLNDNRIKDYVREILQDEHRLPDTTTPSPPALPAEKSS
jgi:signal transduction histidine kinase